jgi:ankyrin repeat protein
MESVTEDLVLTLSVYLSPQAREVLFQTSKSYSTALTKARDNQFYWLKKLEALLNITVPEHIQQETHNWKLAYVQARKNPLLLFTNNDSALYAVGLLAGFDPSSDGNFALLTACVRGNTLAVIRLLQDPGVDPAAMYSNSIKLAAERGHVDVLDILLRDDRADPTDGSDDTPLILAIKEGQETAAIRLLQDTRVSSDIIAVTNALEYAIHKKQKKLTKYILDEMNILPVLDVNRLLLLVSSTGDVEAVRLLLSYAGIDATYRNNLPIREAYKYKHPSVVAELLNRQEVRTTLDKASLRQYVDYVRY